MPRDQKVPLDSKVRGERAEYRVPRVTRVLLEWTACLVLLVKRARRAILVRQVFRGSPEPEGPKAYLAHLDYRAPKEQAVNPDNLDIKENADLGECPEVRVTEVILDIPDRRERGDLEDPLETLAPRDLPATEDRWEREVFPEMSETPDHRERRESQEHVGGEVNPDLTVNQGERVHLVRVDRGVLPVGQAWTVCRDQSEIRESVGMKDAPEKWDHQEMQELWGFKGPRDRQGPGDLQGETEIQEALVLRGHKVTPDRWVKQDQQETPDPREKQVTVAPLEIKAPEVTPEHQD